MIELFIKAIEYFPQIAGYAILVGVVVVITIRFVRFHDRTERTNHAFEKMQKTVERIDASLSALNSVLMETKVITQSCYSRENSPRAVNSLGERLLQQSGAEAVFVAMKPELIAALYEKHVGSMLELQREAFNCLLERMNDARLRPAQDFAYEHPTFEGNPLTYTDILLVMALELRDAYQEVHPIPKASA